MATPFSISGTFNLPGDTGLPQDPIQLAFSGQYDHRAEVVLKLTGAGTKAVPFGSLTSPGAKAVVIKMDAGATSPVSVRINGSSTGAPELTAGGLLVYANTTPTAGITSLDVVYTADAVLRIWILG